MTESARRPRRLGESGLCEENPKFGTWSLFKRLILSPRVPLLPLSPRIRTLSLHCCAFKFPSHFGSGLKEEEEGETLKLQGLALDLKFGETF